MQQEPKGGYRVADTSADTGRSHNSLSQFSLTVLARFNLKQEVKNKFLKFEFCIDDQSVSKDWLLLLESVLETGFTVRYGFESLVEAFSSCLWTAGL